MRIRIKDKDFISVSGALSYVVYRFDKVHDEYRDFVCLDIRDKMYLNSKQSWISCRSRFLDNILNVFDSLMRKINEN